jgi:hypothetical protein
MCYKRGKKKALMGYSQVRILDLRWVNQSAFDLTRQYHASAQRCPPMYAERKTMQTTQPWIKMNYKQSENVTAEEQAVREQTERVMNAALEALHQVSDGLLSIEVYPCDDTCSECKLVAAEAA